MEGGYRAGDGSKTVGVLPDRMKGGNYLLIETIFKPCTKFSIGWVTIFSFSNNGGWTMKRGIYLFLVITLLAAALAVPAAAEPVSKSYLLISASNVLPANLDAKVAKAGGTLLSLIPEIGIAVAESSSASFKASAGKIRLRAVVPDVTLQWIDL
jgi:hypothetical protein